MTAKYGKLWALTTRVSKIKLILHFLHGSYIQKCVFYNTLKRGKIWWSNPVLAGKIELLFYDSYWASVETLQVLPELSRDGKEKVQA
jgi:hypothetical protein